MILMFDEVIWFNKILRPFFAGIDHMIYSLIGWILEGIFTLANLQVSVDLVKVIYQRIYVVLSLFMIFKLSISFLQYLTNPDAMTDKERGFGKLLTRIVIMLCMLVAVPILFFEPVKDNKPILVVLQDGVLGTLPKVILGMEETDSVTENAQNNGQIMAIQMLKSLYYPAACDPDRTDIYNEETCNEEKSTNEISSLAQFKSSITSNKDGYYTYQYVWPMTTVAGVFLAVILLGIAIDVAIRVFKLLILQVIAPVPIMSYIDPKSSKDGAFGNWSKNLVSTYIDIFVKIGIVYIILMLISEVFKGSLFNEEIAPGNFKLGAFIKVFLIIGLFKFAKDAPKFIKDALGMKDSGGGGIFGGLSTLGAAAGTLGGAAAGLIGGVAGGAAAATAAGQNKALGALKGLGGGLAGAARGGIQGAKGAAKGNLIKGMSGAISAQNALTQRKMEAAADGSTLLGRMGARSSKFFTGQDAADRDESRLKTLEEEKSKFDTAATAQGNLYDYIMDQGKKKGATSIIGTGFRGGTLVTSYDKYNTAYQTAKSQGAHSFTFTDEAGFSHDIETNSGEAAALLGDLQEASATHWAINNQTDAALIQYQEQAGVVIGSRDASGNLYEAGNLKKAKKGNEAESRRVARESFNIKTSKGYKANRANAAAVKKGK